MVAGSYTIEVESPLEAKRLWNATKDIHNLMPKQAPALISGITLLQGDGGVGTIRQVNFTEDTNEIAVAANKDFNSVKEKVELIDEANMVYGFSHHVEGVNSVKEKVDLIDEANMVYGFSHVEGGQVGTKVAYTNFKVKITPKPEGGCISTTTCSYDTLHGVPYDEAKVEEIKAGSTALFRMIEESLIANPALYS